MDQRWGGALAYSSFGQEYASQTTPTPEKTTVHDVFTFNCSWVSDNSFRFEVMRRTSESIWKGKEAGEMRFLSHAGPETFEYDMTTGKYKRVSPKTSPGQFKVIEQIP